MKAIEQIMSLVDTYGSECCSGNEYDNRYAKKQARDAVLKALKDYAPPRRSKKAQPLTDEQILHFVDIYVGAPSMAYPLDTRDWLNFARAIEAAHGIKGQA